MRKVPREVCRKEFKDALEEVDDDATKDDVETEKHIFLAKRARASLLFASCRRSGGSDCFAKFKATFEKDDDSEAASAAAEESAKNAAEFIAACMKDESVSDKSSCRAVGASRSVSLTAMPSKLLPSLRKFQRQLPIRQVINLLSASSWERTRLHACKKLPLPSAKSLEFRSRALWSQAQARRNF